MISYTDELDSLVEFIKVLAERSRLDIILLLKDNPKTPIELQEALKKSQSTVSQQLKILLQANIINVRQEGVKKTYFIKSPQIYSILDNLTAFIKNSEFSDILV